MRLKDEAYVCVVSTTMDPYICVYHFQDNIHKYVSITYRSSAVSSCFQGPLEMNSFLDLSSASTRST